MSSEKGVLLTRVSLAQRKSRVKFWLGELFNLFLSVCWQWKFCSKWAEGHAVGLRLGHRLGEVHLITAGQYPQMRKKPLSKFRCFLHFKGGAIHSFSSSCLSRFSSSRFSMTYNTQHALAILIPDTCPQFLLLCLYLHSPTLPSQQSLKLVMKKLIKGKQSESSGK